MFSLNLGERESWREKTKRDRKFVFGLLLNYTCKELSWGTLVDTKFEGVVVVVVNSSRISYQFIITSQAAARKQK